MTASNSERQKVIIIDDNAKRSRQLADNTGLTLAQRSDVSSPFTLQWINDKLTLRNFEKKQPVDINIDFTAGRTLHRLKYGGGHGQPMARAVKSRDKPLICDATAGFGKDAFVFASLECEVIMLERSVVVHALLNDALHRASTHPQAGDIVKRMHLYCTDSCSLPDNWPHPEKPNVIYLDPMYPDGKRTAKKEMQTLRDLLEEIPNEASLLSAARACAKRVVVKRPDKALPLAGITPAGTIKSPNTRYDIYSDS